MHVTIICMQTRPNVVHLENIRCAKCVWVCDVRCAMLLHSKNLLPIQTDRISLVFMFSKFTVAIRIPRITKNTSLILHLYFCFVIISNFFFRWFLVSFWYSFGRACVCVCVCRKVAFNTIGKRLNKRQSREWSALARL